MCDKEEIRALQITRFCDSQAVRWPTKAPNLLSHTGNAVVSLWTGHAVVPYTTGGVGGLTMFERPSVGGFDDETFLTGNVGGGVKWYARNNRFRGHCGRGRR